MLDAVNAKIALNLKERGMPHTEEDVWNIWYDSVIYPIAVHAAKSTCEDQIKWINKLGGGRSRSEGVQWLKRIIKRLSK